jgi:hypothetical protein
VAWAASAAAATPAAVSSAAVCRAAVSAAVACRAAVSSAVACRAVDWRGWVEAGWAAASQAEEHWVARKEGAERVAEAAAVAMKLTRLLID